MDVELGDILAGRAGRTRNQSTTASSIGCRRHPASSTRVAARAGGILPPKALNSGRPCGPEIRTMAMALGNRPDDNAKMV